MLGCLFRAINGISFPFSVVGNEPPHDGSAQLGLSRQTKHSEGPNVPVAQILGMLTSTV